MVGRGYTMKEMKLIVDYLTERRLYGEIKGRKMWVDLAHSKIIDRTWQSLKETFLKRILPDIHNPYYKLSVEQIASFRQGYDIESKNTGKLEIITLSEDSNSTDIQKKNDNTETQDEKTGENQRSEIQTRTRSSTDTIILEPCDDDTEDAQKGDGNDETTAPKSLRDLITYSAPLTPMLQDVIDDFATDDEEPQLQIVEEPEADTTEIENRRSKSPTTIRETQSFTKKPENRQEQEKSTQSSRIKSLKLKKTQKGTWENKEVDENLTFTVRINETNNNESNCSNVVTDNLAPNRSPNNNGEAAKSVLGIVTVRINETNNNESNCSNVVTDNLAPNRSPNNNGEAVKSVLGIDSMVDTPLPNNQEELGNKSNENQTPSESANSGLPKPPKKSKKDKSRKRSHSRSSTDSKKKRKDKIRDISETREQEVESFGTYNSHPHAIAEIQLENSNKSLEKGLISPSSAEKKTNSVDTTSKNDDNSANINSLEAIKGTMDVVEKESITKNNEGTSQEAGPSGIKHVDKNSENLKPDEINPCLQSVNLYEEQFSQSKYSDLEDEEPKNKESNTELRTDQASKDIVDEKLTENRNDEKMEVSSDTKESTSEVLQKNVGKKTLKDDVLLLKSHSDSDGENFVVPLKKNPVRLVNNSRSKVLANIFGFASGGPSHTRAMNHKTSRHVSRHTRIQSRNLSNTFESGSSDDYTTDSGSEQRPQSRGQNRRYIKPHSYEILSHEGSLFVIGRKKIYPIILKESGSSHFATLREEEDGGSAESFWKTKYLEMKQKIAEEKIRGDELARLLKKAKDESRRRSSRSESPILQIRPSLTNHNHTKTENTSEQKPEETVKIKFTKNKEIELEGQWPHVTPMFEKMVQIFKSNEAQKVIEVSNGESENRQDVQTLEKNSVQVKPDSKRVKMKKPDETLEISSGVSGSGIATPNVKDPVDPEVQKQVNKLEGEIFKKIEEIEKAGQNEADNITKRKRGRPRKESSSSISSSGSLAKKSKPLKTDIDPSTNAQTVSSKPQPEPAIQEEPITDKKTEEKEKDTDVKTKPQDTKRKNVASKSNAGEESDASVTSKRSLRPPRRYGSDTGVAQQTKKSNVSLAKSSTTIPDDPNVKYMFPPSTKTRQTVNSNKNTSSYSNYASCNTSPDNCSRTSESTQGYQDSDVSPQKILRKKRKLITGHSKSQRRTRNSCPYLADDDSCEVTDPKKHSVSVPNTTASSDVYKSDSYALLLPKKKPVVLFKKIDEIPNRSTIVLQKLNFDNLTPLTINVSNEFYVPPLELRNDSSKEKSSIGNSSNVSLPLSPELSVVENLSITRDTINGLVDHPTLNETEANIKLTTNCTKYLISEMDVSVPLMGQDCKLKNQLRNTQAIPMENTVSESFPNDVGAGHIEEQSSSELLERKLKELLLESAKKAVQNNPANNAKDNFMNVDVTASLGKKARARKRSSTPQKKKITSKSKPPDVDCVLEEHTESCSISGRLSCPPVINIVPCEDPLPSPDIGDKNISEEINNINTRGRKKKDVIKVKILRPRSKSGTREGRCSRISGCTDSGINDTVFRTSGSSSNCSDDSTELRHNHSDTCLRMDDCIGDSIELIENTTSIITVDSDSSCFVSQNEHASNVEMPNDIGTLRSKLDDIDLLLSSLEKTNETGSNLEIPCVTELGFKIPNNNEMDSEEFVTPELFGSDAQEATVVSSGDLALKLLSLDANIKSPVLSTPATTTYHSPCNSFSSLLTEDLSGGSSIAPQPTLDKWYLFSEDDSTLAGEVNSTSTRGSNLNHIFPVTCAVPNLSTISEASKSPKLIDVKSPGQSLTLFGFKG